MVKVWFPNMFMRLISLSSGKSPAQAVLYVPPKMTKFEIKEYLTKIYSIPVLKVATANYLGMYKVLIKYINDSILTSFAQMYMPILC